MVDVLSPTAEPSVPDEDYTPRFTVAGRGTLGLCSNGFTDASGFLADIERALARDLTDIEFRHYAKRNLRHSSFPLTDLEIKSIASECDAVIAAYGHCGSCTSGTIRDAASLARSGVAVVSIVTKKFADEAFFIARAAGISGLPILVVPHPVAGREQSYQERLAADIAPRLLEALVTGRSS